MPKQPASYSCKIDRLAMQTHAVNHTVDRSLDMPLVLYGRDQPAVGLACLGSGIAVGLPKPVKPKSPVVVAGAAT